MFQSLAFSFHERNEIPAKILNVSQSVIVLIATLLPERTVMLKTPRIFEAYIQTRTAMSEVPKRILSRSNPTVRRAIRQTGRIYGGIK